MAPTSHRKTLDYCVKDAGFNITDMRVLPSGTDAAHWLLDIARPPD